MNLSGAVIYLISTITDLYVAAIMLRLLLQWVKADFYNPLSQFLVKVTNPVLVPARRVIPSIGPLDTASVVVMLFVLCSFFSNQSLTTSNIESEPPGCFLPPIKSFENYKH